MITILNSPSQQRISRKTNGRSKDLTSSDHPETPTPEKRSSQADGRARECMPRRAGGARCHRPLASLRSPRNPAVLKAGIPSGAPTPSFNAAREIQKRTRASLCKTYVTLGARKPVFPFFFFLSKIVHLLIEIVVIQRNPGALKAGTRL